MTTIIKRRLALYFSPLMLQVILQCLGYQSNVTSTLRAQNLGVNATGATPHNSSIIDLNTGNTFTSPNGKGILPPSVALTGVTDAVTVTSPATSLLVYNTATAGSGTTAVVPGYYYWDGAMWARLQTTSGAAQDWNLLGNAGTTAGTNFIGTTDAVDFVIKTNNTENMRVLSNGNVGIGTSLPSAKFHLFGGDGIIADNTQANFSVNRTAQTLYLDNLKSWSDNGLRMYDGNSNGHFHIGNSGISYLQSYAPASIAPGTLGTSTLDFDDNANFSNILLNPLGGNVGIGTNLPSFKLHVPAGGIGADYINTTDNSVATGVTGIMVKAGDNFHRTATAAAINTFLGITAPTGDNLGNHTATTTLNMNANYIDLAQGSSRFAQSNNTSTSYADAPMQLREAQFAGGLGAKAPRLSFHWGGVVASQISIESTGRLAFLNNPGTAYENTVAQEIYSNGWFRNINTNTGLYNETNATGIFSPSLGVMAIYNNGKLGIGTTTPTEKLEVQGSVKIVDGTEGAGKVLTSDVAGKASWQNVGLGAPGTTSNWGANAVTPPEIYPYSSLQTYGPYTIPTTGWYILSSSRWFYEQNTASSADLGAAAFWLQINTSATNLMDQPGQVYEYRGVSNVFSACPPSGSFVYMLAGTSYYVHQQTEHCQSASTGERGFVWSFVQ